MVETHSQRNCVNRAGTVSEGPMHSRKNVRSGHSQTVIKLPDQETWEHVIMEDLCVKGLRREVAQNRAEWRSATT